YDLTRHGLRDFDNRSQIQAFHECADRVCGTGNRLLLPEARIQLVELLHLAIGSPAEIAVAGFSQIRLRYLVETRCHIKPAPTFIGDALNVYEAVLSCRADRSIV